MARAQPGNLHEEKVAMSTKQKILVGLAFVIAGITVQFRSRSSRELPANAAPLELKGSPIQTTAKTVPEPEIGRASCRERVLWYV